MRKFEYTTLIKYLIIISTVMILGVFLFFIRPEQIKLNTIRVSIALMGMFSFFLVLNCKAFHYDEEFDFAKKYVGATLVIVIIFLFYTCYLYEYSLFSSFSLCVHYFYLLFSFGIIYVLKYEKREGDFWKRIICITMFFVVVRFIAWISFNYMDSSILINFVDEYSGWKRNGLHRLISGQTFPIVYILLVSRISNISHKGWGVLKLNGIPVRFEYFVILFMIFYEIFVTQSRYASVVMIITFVWTLFLIRRKATSRLVISLIVLISIVCLITSGFLDSFFSSFTYSGSQWLSTLARYEGANHFWNLFKNTGHSVGLGFVANGYTTTKMFYRTSWLTYYIEDLGIAGAFFRFGVFIIPIYALLFLKAIKICIISKKNNDEKCGLILATTIYMILSCMGSNIYDAQTAFAVPFYVAIISYMDGRNKKVLRSGEMI